MSPSLGKSGVVGSANGKSTENTMLFSSFRLTSISPPSISTALRALRATGPWGFQWNGTLRGTGKFPVAPVMWRGVRHRNEAPVAPRGMWHKHFFPSEPRSVPSAVLRASFYSPTLKCTTHRDYYNCSGDCESTPHPPPPHHHLHQRGS